MEKVLGLAAVDYSDAERVQKKKPRTRQNASRVSEAVARWNISTKGPITPKPFPHQVRASIGSPSIATTGTVDAASTAHDEQVRGSTTHSSGGKSVASDFGDFGNYDRSKTRAAQNKSVARMSTAQLQQQAGTRKKKSKTQLDRAAQEAAIQAQHDQVKALMGLLAKNNLTVEQLMSMNEVTQKQTLLDIARSHYGDGLDEVRLSMDLNAALRGIVSFNRSLTPLYKRVVHTQGTVSNGRLYARHLPTDMLPKPPLRPQQQQTEGADSVTAEDAQLQSAAAKSLNDVVLLGSCGSPEHKSDGTAASTDTGPRTVQFRDARQRMLEVIRRTPLGNVKYPLTLTVKDTSWEERAKLLKESTAITAATNGVFNTSGTADEDEEEQNQGDTPETAFSKPGDRLTVVAEEADSGKKMADFKKYFKLIEV